MTAAGRSWRMRYLGWRVLWLTVVCHLSNRDTLYGRIASWWLFK